MIHRQCLQEVFRYRNRPRSHLQLSQDKQLLELLYLLQGKYMFQYADFLADQARESAKHHGAEDVEAKAVLGDPADEVVAQTAAAATQQVDSYCPGTVAGVVPPVPSP